MARPNLSGIHVHIEIEDFEELNSAKHVAINVPATTTVKALLQKIAKKVKKNRGQKKKFLIFCFLFL